MLHQPTQQRPQNPIMNIQPSSEIGVNQETALILEKKSASEKRFHSEKVTNSETAPVQEVFSSLQGEGVLVGKRQIFVRFAHCHLSCAYCDTPMQSVNSNCFVETPIASGAYAEYKNPVAGESFLQLIEGLLAQMPHHSVSITGGEPLLYWRFLKQVLPELKQHLPTYLETSGTQPDFLAPLLPWLDWVAMDIKLPSATKEPPVFDKHQAFYQCLKQSPGLQCIVKIIFNTQSTQEEMQAVIDIVSERSTPIILQPETCLKTGQLKFNAQHAMQLEKILTAVFDDVRVIPQTHKMLQVL
ncbi:MAG: 7-carboxy-7-deazaguanine synthase QueE [Cyanobacteria bacterium P01_H01_bin.74]